MISFLKNFRAILVTPLSMLFFLLACGVFAQHTPGEDPAETRPLYQPSDRIYSHYEIHRGIYPSRADAEFACSIATAIECSALTFGAGQPGGAYEEVVTYSYESSAFWDPGRKSGNGKLNCDTAAIWVFDCSNNVWEVAPLGCKIGYIPDEEGRCALECENGLGRSKNGACSFQDPDEKNDFPNELVAAMDGLPLCFNELSPLLGNPINYLTGNKVQHETDYIVPGKQPFAISRTYNSNTGTWTFSTEESLWITYADEPSNVIISAAVELGDGKRVTFDYSPAQEGFAQRNIVDGTLTAHREQELIVAYVYEDQNRVVRRFSPNGELQQILYPNGGFHAFATTAYGRRVEDSLGNIFEIHRSNGDRVTKIRTGGIDVVAYEYNSSQMLESVRYPDETEIIYLYEDSQRPRLLTGKIGQTGYRTSTWAYNSAGLATETLHHKNNGDIIARYELSYVRDEDGQSGRVTVINPLGKSTTYHYETIAGLRKAVKVEGHPTQSCLAANREYEYYPNGLLKSSLDWSGVETYYEYNSRGLTTKVVTAKNTDVEREINYVWHEVFNSPTEILEENRKTILSYDSMGNVITKTIEPR